MKHALADGHYLSIYSAIDPVSAAHDIYLRHDQSMALWKKSGRTVELIRYWEFERISGIKHHSLSFASRRDAIAFIDAQLAVLGMSSADLIEIWGTPGLEQIGGLRISPEAQSYPYHSIAHLFSGMLSDTSVFRNQKVLAMAVDGAPDLLFEREARRKPYYAAAFCDLGQPEFFPVSSPAVLWAFLKSHYRMAEGSLMALANAATARAKIEAGQLIEIRDAAETAAAGRWLKELAGRIDALEPKDEGTGFTCLDPRFSFEENRISMAAKLVQEVSNLMMHRNVARAVDRFQIDPRETVLSVSGGFALNCPATAFLTQSFGFRGVLQSPPVNDSGLSLGIGLHQFFENDPGFTFSFGHAFYGRGPVPAAGCGAKAQFSPFIKSSRPAGPERFVDDILQGPVVRISGPAEIGPRALGNRSLLADPRSEKTLGVLNRIKQRQWWRPVAPIVLEEDAGDFFENAACSPYMLRTFQIRAGKAHLVPAIRHLDASARVQTVSRKQNAELHAFLTAFKERTGIPMLCNTSLNDKDEPIIDSLAEAMNFALRKGLPVIYSDGCRIRLQDHSNYSATGPLPRAGAGALVRSKAEKTTSGKLLNPFGISRKDLIVLSSVSLIDGVDLQDQQRVERLRRRAFLLGKRLDRTLALDFTSDWHSDQRASADRAAGFGPGPV
ncbi:carbamoyltransferase C-terminal domain-containing protein [Leisingera sp. ANG-S5]|uniref:carbamoyltransferase C-terminal domain-containing protein n=1 Tax=Leisingera sp. ANG-S5 TaxID=1577901 RepID=UPI00068BDFD3|nr:carbamoyltransferase C-terminal domain-containing protein [Leisingera sp. ANG-S5]